MSLAAMEDRRITALVDFEGYPISAKQRRDGQVKVSSDEVPARTAKEGRAWKPFDWQIESARFSDGTEIERGSDQWFDFSAWFRGYFRFRAEALLLEADRERKRR